MELHDKIISCNCESKLVDFVMFVSLNQDAIALLVCKGKIREDHFAYIKKGRQKIVGPLYFI
jgi:hypothetical protein